ncbi:MAG: acyl carrier protein [Betaproteobacteria bacterium]|jgi:acyl carrier protein|nr:acyl carrier protein [Betaproteobacteria bacterium]
MSDLLRELKYLVVEVLNLEQVRPEDIGDDTLLFNDEGLGLDSIDALELGVALQKKYRLHFERGDQRIREHFRSVRTLADLIRSQGAAA